MIFIRSLNFNIGTHIHGIMSGVDLDGCFFDQYA